MAHSSPRTTGMPRFNRGNLCPLRARSVPLLTLCFCCSIALVAGYVPGEVRGFNAFRYMHQDDSKWAQVALEQSMSLFFSIFFLIESFAFCVKPTLILILATGENLFLIIEFILFSVSFQCSKIMSQLDFPSTAWRQKMESGFSSRHRVSFNLTPKQKT